MQYYLFPLPPVNLTYFFFSFIDMSGDKKADVGAGSSTDFQFVSKQKLMMINLNKNRVKV